MNLDEYNIALRNYTGSTEFASLTPDEQQQEIKLQREAFIFKNPNEDVAKVNEVTEYRNKSFLRGTGQGRAVPKIDPAILPNSDPEFDSLSKEEKIKRIDDFRININSLADQNPTQKEDTAFFLEQTADQLERRVNGEGRSWVADKASRTSQGFVAGLLNYAGMDDAASSVEKYFHENPEMDSDFASMLAGGVGDVGASMTIFLGTALLTKGAGGGAVAQARAATGASLASNSIMRYNEAYKNAIDSGLDSAQANDAGISALPAAALDVLGDKIIGGRFLTKDAADIFLKGTAASKRAALGGLIADSTSRAKLFEIGMDAVKEGVTEVVGDQLAAYGPYLVTGVDDYLPDDKSVRDSFLVGAVLGGGIAGASNVTEFIGNKTMADGTKATTTSEAILRDTATNIAKIEPDDQQQVYELLGRGQYKQALNVTKEILSQYAKRVPEYTALTNTEVPLLEAPRDPATALDAPKPEPKPIILGGVSAESTPEQKAEQAQQDAVDNIMEMSDATPVNQTIYRELTDAVFSASKTNTKGNTPEAKNVSRARNTELDSLLPDRGRVRGEIINISLPGKVKSVQQKEAVNTVIDTVGLRWLAANPDRDLNEFYQKININSASEVDKIANLSSSFMISPDNKIVGAMNRVDNSVTLAPQASLDNVLDGIVYTMRATGIMEDILTPDEFALVKTSLGVADSFEEKDDAELAKRFKDWLSTGNSEISPVMGKLKKWVSDIYKSLRRLVDPRDRDRDLDSTFQNLFGISLTPQEFNDSTRQEPVIDKVVDAPSPTLVEAQKNLDDAKAEAQRVMGPTPKADVRVDKTEQFDTVADLVNSLAQGPDSAIYNRMLADLIAKNPDVKLVEDPNLPYPGYYNSGNNTIVIRNFTQKVIAHEVTHAVTQADIVKHIDNQPGATYQEKIANSKASESVPVYIKTIIDAYQVAASNLGHTNEIGKGMADIDFANITPQKYAFFNVHEFVAAAMSSQNFQETLSNIPYKGSTIWSTIADAVSNALTWIRSITSPENALRSDGENVLTATLAATNRIINSDSEININSDNESYSYEYDEDIQEPMDFSTPATIANFINSRGNMKVAPSYDVVKMIESSFKSGGVKQVLSDIQKRIYSLGDDRSKPVSELRDLMESIQNPNGMDEYVPFSVTGMKVASPDQNGIKVLKEMMDSDPENQEVYNRMIADLEEKNPKVAIVFDGSVERSHFDSKNNIINLRTDEIGVVAHEVIHAVTNMDINKWINWVPGDSYIGKLNYSLESNDTPDYIKSLIRVYLHSAEKLGYTNFIEGAVKSNDEGKTSFQYGFKNIDEFIARTIDSNKFRRQLSRIPYKTTNVLQSIKDAISSAMDWILSITSPEMLFENNGNNALSETLSSIHSITRSKMPPYAWFLDDAFTIRSKAANSKININDLRLGMGESPFANPAPASEFISDDEAEMIEREQAQDIDLSLNSIVSNIGNRNLKMADFLSSLANESNDKDAVIFNQMANDVRNKNPDVKFYISERNAPAFSVAENTIEISPREINKMILAHEVAHALTHFDVARFVNDRNENTYSEKVNAALKDKSTPEYIRTLIDVYQKSATALGKELNVKWGREGGFSNNGGPLDYAFSSLDEFMSAAMSDDIFQKILSNVPYKGKSMWRSIVDAISSAIPWMKNITDPKFVLRSRSRNALTSTLASINTIINNGRTANYSIDNGVVSPAELKNKSANPEININYTIGQTPAQRTANTFKRLAAIKKGKLSDRFDTNTQQIIDTMKTIRPSDVRLLGEVDPAAQESFFRLVDNVYESRKNTVPSPQNRASTTKLLQQVEAMQNMMDKYWISDAIATYDGLINWGPIDLSDRTAVAQRINQYETQDNLLDQAKKLQNQQTRAAALQEKYQNYRNQFKKLRDDTLTRFATPENYLKELEATYGQPIAAGALRDFMGVHFEYLSNVDIDALEGGELYKHFYAINNLYDGTAGYFDLTVKFISALRNNESAIYNLTGTFRDPMIDGNAIRRQLDSWNQKAELIQVQAQRFSAMEKTRKFIDNDLLGQLNKLIISDSKNMESILKNQTLEARKAFEKEMDSVMGVEDQAALAIASRLFQYQVGLNADAELKKNIHKERQSLENKIRLGIASEKTLYRTVHIPIFNRMVAGLEEMDAGSMAALHSTIEKRMAGANPIKRGAELKKVLQTYQDVFSTFDLDSRMISEGFHATPYYQFANYVPNVVQTADSQPNEVPWNLTDALKDSEADQFQSGLKSKASHLKERSEKLTQNQFYSYNIESIVDRNVTRISVDSHTIAERFILNERLKRGSELNEIISGGAIENRNRIDGLKNLAKTTINNAVSRGEPANLAVSIVRKAVNTYAKVALSGIHHVITQPLTAFVDYGIRNNDFSGWMAALRFYTQNADKMNEWFDIHQKWTGGRGALEAQSLDTRTPRADSKFANSKLMQKMDSLYEGIGDVITTSIRVGDRYSTKVTVIAEYVRLLKEKGYKIDSLDNFDFSQVEGNLLSQAVISSEKNINTSGKTLRGELFSDRRMSMTVIRNLLFAFSSHQANLATQMQMAFRDILELRRMGASREEIEPKIRTIAAIGLQTFTFTASSAIIGSLMGKAMIATIQEVFDDEEDKIASLAEKVDIARKKGDKVKIAQAQAELDNAKKVRAVVEKMRNSTSSTDSFFKRVVRDQTGSVSMLFGSADANRLVFFPFDGFSEKMHRDTKEEVVADYKVRIKQAKDRGRMKEAYNLEEQLVNFSAQEYIPFAYDSISGMEIGGIYGAALSNLKSVASSVGGAVMGEDEFNTNDIVIMAATAGVGQADLRKLMKAIDKIENEQLEVQTRLEDEGIPKAKKEAKEKKQKELQKLIDSF